MYGRNFDWDVGIGAVMVNLRGVEKSAFVLPPDKPLTWKAKYGSVTFNQFSKEIPVGGMNEKGLVIECLVSVAQHPERDDRPAVNELQWIQYHLDTCQTVEEVLESAKNVRITPYAVRLHYYLTDAKGNSAVLEWIGGKQVLHTGETLPTRVLANRPYQSSMADRETSRGRFARAARLLDGFRENQDAKSFTFQVLDEVAQGSYTKWQVFYDLTNQTITFRTSENRNKRWIRFEDLNFDEKAVPMMLDVNAKGKGDLHKQFQPFTQRANDALIQECLVEFRRNGIARHMTMTHVMRIRKTLYSED